MDGSKNTPEPSPKGNDSSTAGSAERTDSPNSPVTTGNPTDKLVVPRSRAVLFFSLAILGGIADLWSKSFIFSWRGLPGDKDIWWIVDGYFGIETAVNIGAVFGLGAGKGTIFAAFSIIAAIGICIWLFWFKAAVSLWLTTALGLVTGGSSAICTIVSGFGGSTNPAISWNGRVAFAIGFCFRSPVFLSWIHGQISTSRIVCWWLVQECYFTSHFSQVTSLTPMKKQHRPATRMNPNPTLKKLQKQLKSNDLSAAKKGSQCGVPVVDIS